MQLNPTSSPAHANAAHGKRAAETSGDPAAAGFSAMLDAAFDAVASPSAAGTAARPGGDGSPAASQTASPMAVPAAQSARPAAPAKAGNDTAATDEAAQAAADKAISTSQADNVAPATDDVAIEIAGDADASAGDQDIEASTNELTQAEQARQAVDAMLALLPPGRLHPAAPAAPAAPSADATAADAIGQPGPASPALLNAASNPAVTGVPVKNAARNGKSAAERALPETAAEAASEAALRNAQRQSAQEPAALDSPAGARTGAAASRAAANPVAGNPPAALPAMAEGRAGSFSDIIAAQRTGQPSADAIVPAGVPTSPQAAPAGATLPAVHVPAAFGSSAWPQAFNQQVMWSASQQLQSASLTLNPPELGPVRIELKLTNTQAIAQFSSHQPEVRQAIEQALPQLKDMFANAGLQLQQASVDSGQSQQQERQAAWAGTPARGTPGASASLTDDAGSAAPRAMPAVSQRLLDTYA